ncbi:MAG: AAA family ATPase [Victivallales bacterium]|nr:AAA family ATPase [Victivallales bacterium]
MIIKNIHIDNYGKYSGRGFSGFTSGVNVLYGPNEHGKTTLLEFVRRMFFGFPPGTYKKNRFAPVNDALPGGRLICSSDSGREIRIERLGWKKGGTLKIDSREAGQHELDELLRAGELFYRNVYAITIEELFSMDALSNDEIKNRIYGAGLGLGGLSLTKIKKQFRDAADGIFRPGGSKQQIHLLNEERRDIEHRIKLAERGLGRYEEILQEQADNEEKIAVIAAGIKKLNAGRAELENKCSALSEFIAYESFEAELKAIPECPVVTQSDVDEYRELQNALAKAVTRREESEAEIRELEEKLAVAVINRKLPEYRGRITMLERASGRYRAERENISTLIARAGQLEDRLTAAENNIASLWQGGKIPDDAAFELEFCNRVREFETGFNDFRQQFMALETLRRQREQMPQAYPVNNLVPALLLFALFAAAVILGGVLLPPAAAIAAAVLVCIPVSIIIARGFRREKVPESESQPDDFEKRRAELTADWRKLLRERGFREELAPGSVLAGAEEYKNLARDRSDLQELRRELKSKKDWVQEIDAAVKEIATVLEPGALTPDTPANIEIISGIAGKNEKAVADHENWQSELKKVKSKLAAAAAATENGNAAVTEFLNRFHAADLLELQTMLRHTDERKNLNDKLQNSLNRLRNSFGIEAKIADIRSQLREFSRDEAEGRLKDLAEEQDRLEKERKVLNEKTGALNAEAEMLVSGDQLAELYNRHENSVQRIRDHAACWVRFRTAELLIDRAISKYELERQPEVITQASVLFGKLTGGEYAAIRKPAESDDLLLLGADGNVRKVLELSRGTREQLYLAMRLGLIAQYEEKTESLPLIFDDVLVDFDGPRLQNAVTAIFEFARKRQVIILTCHENMYKLMLKHGAVDIAVMDKTEKNKSGRLDERHA